jgi:glutamate N-acetyltransferase/amino-acid N-acetyltransferase
MELKNVKFASTNCGIRYKSRDDLMIAVFEDGASVAGVFTKSKIVSATVLWCKKALKNGKASALVVNSGNANTFTGKKGDLIVKKTVEKLAKELNCNKENIFVSSTGVIGELFDPNLITAKIPQLISELKSGNEAFESAAKAIMTTDLVKKISCKKITINGQEIVIKGFAKGSGMIAPNMATMLAYIFTDAKIDSEKLAQIFKEINEQTFNSITVDSDCSTNDTALIFALNQKEINDFDAFKAALKEVMIDLAKQIVKDGEGAKKVIKIDVIGAKNEREAKLAAFAIANSPLVKSAIAACDPNWGRIMMAIGKSGAKIAVKKIGLEIGGLIIAIDGAICENYKEKEVHEYLKNHDEVEIKVNLGIGDKSWCVYGCDLNEEYVSINKSYRS